MPVEMVHKYSEIYLLWQTIDYEIPYAVIYICNLKKLLGTIPILYLAGEHLKEGRIRKQGGGRKSTFSKHSEYINIFRKIVECDMDARITTKKEIAIFTIIERNIYETKEECDPLF